MASKFIENQISSACEALHRLKETEPFEFILLAHDEEQMMGATSMSLTGMCKVFDFITNEMTVDNEDCLITASAAHQMLAVYVIDGLRERLNISEKLNFIEMISDLLLANELDQEGNQK